MLVDNLPIPDEGKCRGFSHVSLESPRTQRLCAFEVCMLSPALRFQGSLQLRPLLSTQLETSPSGLLLRFCGWFRRSPHVVSGVDITNHAVLAVAVIAFSTSLLVNPSKQLVLARRFGFAALCSNRLRTLAVGAIDVVG